MRARNASKDLSLRRTMARAAIAPASTPDRPAARIGNASHRLAKTVAPTLSGGYETVEQQQERRERGQEPDRPPAEPGHGQQMESRPVRVLGPAFHATTMVLTLLTFKSRTPGSPISA